MTEYNHNPEKRSDAPTYKYDSEQKRLKVRGVIKFPAEVFNYADKVEILDMSNNGLTSLPDDLGRLTKLRVAFFSNNPFTEVPEVLATCEKLEMVGFKSCEINRLPDHALPLGLRGLILTGNKLTELPASIGEYTQLQKLMLTGNKLTSLPKELLNCQNLELIRVSSNKLTQAPSWLAGLPKLAWYVDSGNEFSPPREIESSVGEEFSWHTIKFGDDPLGESAMNVVRVGTLSGGTQVAVKLFGRGITTDGLPSDDINASLRAGDHSNVIGALGRLVDAPDDQEGLVMRRVPDNFKTLGSPPDMKSLTRDGYSGERQISVNSAFRIIQDIVAAMQDLHEKGIMHGDVYAHNILSTDSGESKIGDFGAASLYDPSSPDEAWREKIDVCGYGHLVEELVQQARLTSTTTDSDTPLIDRLQRLGEACTDKNSLHRPSFADINSLIGAE